MVDLVRRAYIPRFLLAADSLLALWPSSQSAVTFIFLCVSRKFGFLCFYRLLCCRDNAEYNVMAFVFSSLSKPKDGRVKVEYVRRFRFL